MKKILLTSMVLSGFLFANTHNVLTNENDAKMLKEAVTKAINIEKENVKKTNRLFSNSNNSKMIVMAIKNMAEAVFDLRKGDKVSAEPKIKYAIETLKKIKSDIIPIQAKLFILEFKGSISEAKMMLKKVEGMIKEKNYQGVSHLLNLLKDEMNIMEIDVNKPLLEKKLEKVLQLIKSNKTKEAFRELALTFRDPNIVIRAVGIYPLGVIKAAYLIQQSHIINNSTKDYKKMLALIKEAKRELELDNILGYFYPKLLQKQYKKIMNILDSLEKSAKKGEISNKYNEAEKVIKDIKEKSLEKRNNPRYQLIEPSK